MLRSRSRATSGEVPTAFLQAEGARPVLGRSRGSSSRHLRSVSGLAAVVQHAVQSSRCSGPGGGQVSHLSLCP